MVIIQNFSTNENFLHFGQNFTKSPRPIMVKMHFMKAGIKPYATKNVLIFENKFKNLPSRAQCSDPFLH